jgi:translocation and assembly module TamB
VERVQIADINQMLLGTHKLTGEVNGTIRATGPIGTPRATADLVIANGTADGISYDRLTAEASYAAPRLTLDVALEAGAAGRLLAIGSMPLGPAPNDGPRPPYDLRIESPGIQLALFQPLTDEVTKLTGQAVVDLRVAGPADAPSFAGRAEIHQGAFTVPYTGMTYVNVNAAFAVDGTQLTVERFRLEDQDRHVLTVTGGVTVPGAGPSTAFDLYISGDEMHVLNNAFGDVAVTFDLHALGDLQSPLVVGTIEVDHATVEVDDILEQLQSTGYQPLPEERVTETLAVTPDGPRGASYSITLAMPENVVLRGRDLRTGSGPIGLGDINITIGGALSLSKDQGQPVVIDGEVDVVRGNYDFQGRRFAIARGSTLTFVRGATLNPRLAVTAERVISGVTARVRVTGTAREPVIALSSSPSLSQSDILSLIIFGSPTNELLAGERVSLAATAGRLAAGAVATPIADSVARALDLDLFEIRPSDTAGGAVVTVGQQVSDRLFVGFRHEFGPSEGSQVSFEYRLNEFWRVVTSFANSPDRSQVPPRSERAGIDLFYVIRR